MVQIPNNSAEESIAIFVRVKRTPRASQLKIPSLFKKEVDRRENCGFMRVSQGFTFIIVFKGGMVVKAKD
jgi:hypothetical protein